MSRIQRAAIIASLLKKMWDNGSWCGETHIQKAVFFLQRLFSVPLEYEYSVYKHGPYSFDLHDELGELRADYLLELIERPPYGPSYALEENAFHKLNSWERSVIAKFDSEIDYVAKALGDAGVGELEKLSTALFATVSERGDVEQNESKRAAWISRIKPHISNEDAVEAVRRVDRMLDDIKKRFAA